jgi:site-specific recombinase XerD
VTKSYPHDFTKTLINEGYDRKTLYNKRALAADLSRWLDRRGVALMDLNEEHQSQYRRVSARRADLLTLRQLLSYLRDLGCIRKPLQKIDRTALGKQIRDFERFLSAERALSASTVTRYLPTVRSLLIHRFKGRELYFRQLRPRDLHRFILSEGKRVSRNHAKQTITILRLFLGFLLHRGKIDTDLAAGLPGVAAWRLSHLPKSLPPDQVKKLLECCNRSTRGGQRDYAILLLLARLGLRGGEVRALLLDDLDWGRSEILVRGKGQRFERLPLPQDVGEALVHYLRYVRPPCTTRAFFIRLQAPLRGLCKSSICGVVRGALARAGLDPDFKGAHLLRHSLATSMLRKGAALSEIAQILRHTQQTTTQIYAKVDIQALRAIAPPWMGGSP